MFLLDKEAEKDPEKQKGLLGMLPDTDFDSRRISRLMRRIGIIGANVIELPDGGFQCAVGPDGGTFTNRRGTNCRPPLPGDSTKPVRAVEEAAETSIRKPAAVGKLIEPTDRQSAKPDPEALLAEWRNVVAAMEKPDDPASLERVRAHLDGLEALDSVAEANPDVLNLSDGTSFSRRSLRQRLGMVDRWLASRNDKPDKSSLYDRVLQIGDEVRDVMNRYQTGESLDDINKYRKEIRALLSRIKKEEPADRKSIREARYLLSLIAEWTRKTERRNARKPAAVRNQESDPATQKILRAIRTTVQDHQIGDPVTGSSSLSLFGTWLQDEIGRSNNGNNGLTQRSRELGDIAGALTQWRLYAHRVNEAARQGRISEPRVHEYESQMDYHASVISKTIDRLLGESSDAANRARITPEQAAEKARARRRRRQVASAGSTREARILQAMNLIGMTREDAERYIDELPDPEEQAKLEAERQAAAAERQREQDQRELNISVQRMNQALEETKRLMQEWKPGQSPRDVRSSRQSLAAATYDTERLTGRLGEITELQAAKFQEIREFARTVEEWEQKVEELNRQEAENRRLARMAGQGPEGTEFTTDPDEKSSLLSELELDPGFARSLFEGDGVTQEDYQKYLLFGLEGYTAEYTEDPYGGDPVVDIYNANGDHVAHMNFGMADHAYHSYAEESAYIHLVDIKKSERGSGMGSQVLNNWVDWAIAAGLGGISLQANIDVGAAFWGRRGFIPGEDGYSEEIWDSIHNRLLNWQRNDGSIVNKWKSDLKMSADEVKEALDLLYQMYDPGVGGEIDPVLWRRFNEIPNIEAVMQHSNWYGSLILSDEEALRMARGKRRRI